MEPLFEGVDAKVTDFEGKPIAWPIALAGDKGYRSDWIDEYFLEHGIQWVISSQENEEHAERPVCFDKRKYRQRSVIEQLIGWLKESRRIFSCFEKPDKNFAGMLKMRSSTATCD